MSRAFAKEEDQEEAPFIPPRASLPPGTTNYVTATGKQLLLSEKETLEQEKAALALEDAAEQRRAVAVINGKLRQLNERLGSARVLDMSKSTEEVRFGAQVTLEGVGKKLTQTFRIVGVDEADIKQQKIAFISPMARAVTGKKVGEIAELRLGNETRKLKIVKIDY